MDGVERESSIYPQWTNGAAFGLFCDGGYKSFQKAGGRRRKIEPMCGWGFAAYRTSKPSSDGTPLHECCGKVTTQVSSPLYCGAIRLSNSVAELEAALEACLWLTYQSELPDPIIPKGSPIQSIFDAKYTINILLGTVKPKCNLALAMAVRAAWKLCCDCFKMGGSRMEEITCGRCGKF